MTTQIAELFAVGAFADGDEPLPLTRTELLHDVTAAQRALGALGVRPGDHVLLVSKLRETPYFWPFQAAAIRSRIGVATSDLNAFDAARLEMLTRRVPTTAVLAIDGTILDGLGDLGVDPVEVLGRAEIVVARADAAARLAGGPVAARRWLALGPAYAIDCAQGRLHVDSTAWDVSAAGGEVAVTPRTPRAVGAGPFVVALDAAVEQGECSCGRNGDAWLELA